jgi:hypothetical protein
MTKITINGQEYEMAYRPVSAREIQAWIPNTDYPTVYGCGNTLREQIDSAKKSMLTQIAASDTPMTC